MKAAIMVEIFFKKTQVLCNWDWVKITWKLKNTLKFSPKSSGNTFPLSESFDCFCLEKKFCLREWDKIVEYVKTT